MTTRPTFFLVFATLLALLVASVVLDRVDLGRAGNHGAAMAIATVKAALVAWFFMHARTSRRVSWFLFAGGILGLALLLSFVMLDATTRNLPVVPR